MVSRFSYFLFSGEPARFIGTIGQIAGIYLFALPLTRALIFMLPYMETRSYLLARDHRCSCKKDASVGDGETPRSRYEECL